MSRVSTRLLAGRLPPERLFPAGEPDYRVRALRLASGLRVRAVERGPPDGEPVLFLHGWGCWLYTYRKNLPAIAAAGYRTIAVDLKGHGLSDKPLEPEEYTPAALGRHAVEILDALGLARATLVAHSMGGAVAVQAALLAPARVQGLVLLAPIGFGTANLVQLATLLTPVLVSPWLPYVVPRASVVLALWLASGRGTRFTPAEVDQYWAPTQFPAFAVAMRHLLHAFEWAPGRPESLARLHAPVDVLFGSRDRFVRPNAADVYVGHVPQARLHRLAGAGHALAEERPAEVNAVILAHLTQRPTPPRG